MSNVRYRHIVRDYERRFAHKVRLPHCRLWRMSYVDGQLDHLEYGERGYWHVGDERKGSHAAVYGFICPVQAAVLQDWSTRCGIDWSIPPEEQTVWPPRPPRPHRKDHRPPADRSGRENLHGLAGSGRPLGVTCKACHHRGLVPLDRLGAHSGNMQEIRTLKLHCSACQSREWTPKIFLRDEDLAAFVQSTAGTPAF